MEPRNGHRQWSRSGKFRIYKNISNIILTLNYIWLFIVYSLWTYKFIMEDTDSWEQSDVCDLVFGKDSSIKPYGFR